MDWIYLSPHFDDAALSCGGLIWEQSRAGQVVSVWTICAAVPKDGELSPFAESLHQRWQTGEQAASLRRMEDIASNQAMGASYRYFDLPDCIYRKDSSGNFLYDTEESLFGPLHPDEELLVPRLAWQMSTAAGKEAANLVCPLSLGGHVDHRLTRAAVEKWQEQNPIMQMWYYPDFPYALKSDQTLVELKEKGWQEKVFSISEAGLQGWAEAVEAHSSQISTFWPNLTEMRAALDAYNNLFQGIRLYKNPQKSKE
jgi:LmbE family N-acetylglucosaminyl deacetylase